MSKEYMMKQIEILVAMLGEERIDVEKQIISEELMGLYRMKVKAEVQERMNASKEK